MLVEILKDKDFIKRVNYASQLAEHYIWIATFKAEIAHSPGGLWVLPFWETCINHAKNGLDIKLMLALGPKRHCTPCTNILVAKKIKSAGGQVYNMINKRIQHAKIIIIDDEIMFIGSHNLCAASCTDNQEVSALIRDKNAILQAKTAYALMLSNMAKF